MKIRNEEYDMGFSIFCYAETRHKRKNKNKTKLRKHIFDSCKLKLGFIVHIRIILTNKR